MTETLTGRTACALQALVWFVSMGVADANAYSYTPLLAGLALVILLALSAMIRGAKAVQLSFTAWLSLGVGAYFLIRCLCSFSVVESWREASIILGCCIFYLAGVYAAQARSARPLIGVLGIAVVLNLLYFALMQGTDIPMEWGGRPSAGPGGENHRPVTLFVYKNFAGAFLIISGVILTAMSLWFRQRAWSCLLGGGLGTCAVLVSAECGTRSVIWLAAVLVFVGGLIWFILRLNEQESLGGSDVVIGFLFLSCCGILMGWIFLDPDCLSFFSSINSDGRYPIWGLVCRVLPAAPPWGYGADSVQWITLPVNSRSFLSVNFAHNEYLQAWCDYGLIGLFAMIGLLFWHCCRALAIIAEEGVSVTRKRLTAAAFMCLLAWCSAAACDFFWHHFSIAGMTAFSLGLIASPYPSENPRKARRRKVLTQGPFGKSVLGLCGMLSVTLCCWLIHTEWPVWLAQWEYNEISHSQSDADGSARRQLLAKLIPLYPASELMDTYMLLPGKEREQAEQEIELLRIVLRGNPLQLHMVMRLGSRLSEARHFEEAEELFRTHYPNDGMNSRRLADWSAPYAMHLLRWGQHCLYSGEQAKGYSLINYAMSIIDKDGLVHSRTRRFGKQVWVPFPNRDPENWKRYLRARRQELQILSMLQIEPDDSWQAPDASGKPALYRRYAAPESLDKADSATLVAPAGKKE